MFEDLIYPRGIQSRLIEALEDSPVVFVHGPRQCGKTTLALLTLAPNYVGSEVLHALSRNRVSFEGLSLRNKDYQYFNFDNPVVRETALNDPLGFIDDLPDRVILDEIQRVPDIFDAIKIAVDRKRTPGRFLLTGSTSLMLLPKLAESLTGRMHIIRLHPFSQYELANMDDALDLDNGFLQSAFDVGFKIEQRERLGLELSERIVRGGFPPTFPLKSVYRRFNWYRNYVEQLTHRDVRDLTRIRSAEVLPGLLNAAALNTAKLFNLADLASTFELSRPTILEYVTLLESLFLLEKLPAWQINTLSRMIKKPKLHMSDTGLAAALLNADPETLKADRKLLGQLLETFVLQELKRQSSWDQTPTKFFHFRHKDNAEIDIVVERNARDLVGVEVKAAATVKDSDFRGLRKLAGAAADRFVRGIVLYDGEMCMRFGDRLWAVPIRRLWENA